MFTLRRRRRRSCAELGGVVVLGGAVQADKLAMVSGFLFTIAQVEGKNGTFVPILFRFFSPQSAVPAGRGGWVLVRFHCFGFGFCRGDDVFWQGSDEVVSSRIAVDRQDMGIAA